ncbi:MAG TPA: DHA2 family efflux MFS transporter permease subunit [Acidimicrobiales bacterium]|nr:DHA2 family efflux MFS transporter permease subunit [Acidimicrobiales bacterium]
MDRVDESAIQRRRWAILGVLSLSVFLAVVDNTIVNVALPSMSDQLDASNSELQWIVDAYSLVFAGLLLIGGSLGDRFGRKGALQLGVLAFALFSVFAGLAESTGTLILARALMGMAAAFIFPATLAILTNVFTDDKERAAAIGVWTGVVGLAVALGPLTGGALLQHYWWGSIFFVNLPVAALSLGLAAWLVPTSRDPAAPHLDFVGFVLSAIGIVALVYTTIEAPGRGWLEPITIGGYVVAVVVLAAFAMWERRTPEPMLDVTLFSNIRFSAASFSITVSFFALFGFIFLITQYFQLIRGYDTLSAGVHTLPFAIATGAVAPLAPALAYRLGTKIVVPAGLLLMAAGFFVAATLDINTAYVGPVLISMVLIAIGLGFVAAPSTAAILAVLPPAKAGVGSAVNDVTRELGGAFGVAVVGAVFSSIYGPHLLDRLRGLNLPKEALGPASESTAEALKLAGGMPGEIAGTIVHAAQTSFIEGFSRGSIVCGVVVMLGAVFAFLVLPRRLPDVTAIAQPESEPAPA